MKANSVLVFLIVLSGSVLGQNSHPTYWVVETNRSQSNGSIIRLYGESDQLISEVQVEKVIDITKRRQKRKLDYLLRNYNQRLTAGSKKHKSKSSI